MDIPEAIVTAAYEAFVAGPTDGRESMRLALVAAQEHTNGSNA